MIFEAVAVASVAMNIGGKVLGAVEGQRNAKAQNTHNRAVMEQQAKDRDSTMRWQNEVWAQDLEYAQEQLSWAQGEWGRQAEWVGKAQEAVTRNRDAGAFTLMIRAVEEDIASAFRIDDIGRQGRSARGTLRARDRGVEGNSVEAVINDVMRQEGEAVTVQEMNRSAMGRQLYRDSLALDAEADGNLMQIASEVRGMSPNAPIRTPQPVATVAPARTAQGPSFLAAILGAGEAVAGGIQTYNALTNQNTNDTVQQLSRWTRRQFDFGGVRPEVTTGRVAGPV